MPSFHFDFFRIHLPKDSLSMVTMAGSASIPLKVELFLPLPKHFLDLVLLETLLDILTKLIILWWYRNSKISEN